MFGLETIFGDFREVVGNLLKIVKNVVISLYNKENDTCLLLDMSCIELNAHVLSSSY